MKKVRLQKWWVLFFSPVVSNLGPPDVLGLQLPEAYTATSAGQEFWELKSKNIWRPKVEDHCSSLPLGHMYFLWGGDGVAIRPLAVGLLGTNFQSPKDPAGSVRGEMTRHVLAP